MCLWGFICAKSCVARCRQLCARSSCEHAARAASQPVWVKPKSFHIPVPLKLDSLDYVIDFSDFSRDLQLVGPLKPRSGTHTKFPLWSWGSLEFPLFWMYHWMTFFHDSPTPGTIRPTRCPENMRDSAIGQGVKGPIVVKLLRHRGLVLPQYVFFPAMYWVGTFWRGELDLSQISGKIHGSKQKWRSKRLSYEPSMTGICWFFNRIWWSHEMKQTQEIVWEGSREGPSNFFRWYTL